jgi:drug/metabolite transporter (DMT)-like permease
LGAFFGLASAISWGTGDFSGGLASRRCPVYTVVLISQFVGLALLTGLALLLVEPLPSQADFLWGGLAGVAGTVGLVALYRGLAVGRMGLVAPVAAMVTAVVPLLYGLFLEGMPAAPQLAGFGLALAAVWLVARSDGTGAMHRRELGLPLVAGLGFGLFLIVIDHTSRSALLWPLVAARIASTGLLFAVIILAKQRASPAARQLPLIALAGLFDTGGNAFYALAAQAGRLDVAAVLSSLYPATTVLLARLLLKERLARLQAIGVGTALVAVVLIAS